MHALFLAGRITRFSLLTAEGSEWFEKVFITRSSLVTLVFLLFDG
jgi:ACR3 family arsenite efflux pump ArsB